MNKTFVSTYYSKIQISDYQSSHHDERSAFLLPRSNLQARLSHCNSVLASTTHHHRHLVSSLSCQLSLWISPLRQAPWEIFKAPVSISYRCWGSVSFVGVLHSPLSISYRKILWVVSFTHLGMDLL